MNSSTNYNVLIKKEGGQSHENRSDISKEEVVDQGGRRKGRKEEELIKISQIMLHTCMYIPQ